MKREIRWPVVIRYCLTSRLNSNRQKSLDRHIFFDFRFASLEILSYIKYGHNLNKEDEMKRWAFILVIIVAAIILAYIFEKTGLWRTVSPDELKNSIEIIDVETKWVKKYYQPWPAKLILVPAISFRVKNISDKPLRYINFNANFRFKDDYENLGDCFLAAIRNDPVLPGETSDVITLKSNYGVEGKTKESFEKNPYWKTVFVKLFAQSKGSQYVLLGEWEVSKKIEFEEPEPVGLPEKKKIKEKQDSSEKLSSEKKKEEIK